MSAAPPAMPVGLAAIVESLQPAWSGPVQYGRFQTYAVDFSGWRLSLMAATPCIWVPEDACNGTPAALGAALQEAAQLAGWHNNLILVFVDGETADLQAQPLPSLPRFVFLGAADQVTVAAADAPQEMLLHLLRGRLPSPLLAPYETTKPVVSSQFFGREAEIERVINHPTTNFLFVGIRRIGKTSLLKELKRRLDLVDPPEKDQVRRVYVDCTVINSEEALLRTLVFQLEQSGLTLLSSRAREPEQYQQQLFDHYVAVHGQPITFLLDEFDRLAPHMTADWPLLRVLPTAVQAGQVRFILAGFRRAMETIANIRSPFTNLITPVRLAPLSCAEVQQMVVTPLGRLGITIEDEAAVVQRIYEETAGLPNYIQFYCRIALQQLAAAQRTTLCLDDLVAIPENETFRHFVLNTFMSNTELLERAIVYALVAEGEGIRPFHFNQQQIAAALAGRNLIASPDRIDEACRNLEMAGVFRRENADFVFAVPLFQHALRRLRNVTFLFERAREALQTERIVS